MEGGEGVPGSPQMIHRYSPGPIFQESVHEPTSSTGSPRDVPNYSPGDSPSYSVRYDTPSITYDLQSEFEVDSPLLLPSFSPTSSDDSAVGSSHMPRRLRMRRTSLIYSASPYSSPNTADSPSPVLHLEYSPSPFEPECNNINVENGKASSSGAKAEERCCDCAKKQDANSKKRSYPEEDEDEDGKLCPICLDSWTNSGEHRLCALRCGHLFGHNCVERWLSGQKTCPTCKRPVRKSDIRFIYAKKLIALDTSVLNSLQTQLDATMAEKNTLQFKLVQSKTREHNLGQELDDLNKQIMVLKRKTTEVIYPSQSVGASAQTSIKLYKEHSFEISKDGGCRVMDFYKNSNLLVVSAQSPNQLFAGYGVRKVPLNDYKNSVFIPLHSNTIRDVCFHPHTELLLSVSVDKCVRLTETPNNKSVQSIQCTGPIWSCCWDVNNPTYFYIGEQSGEVVKYDIRKINERLCVLKVPGDYSPVVSLATAGELCAPLSVLVCKLNSCSLFVDRNDSNPSENVPHHSLGLAGPFVSMRYSRETKHLMVSSRPNLQSPYARHIVTTLNMSSMNTVNCNIIHSFQGSQVQKLLSRSCQMQVRGDVFVAAHNEARTCVDLWSVTSGVKKNVISVTHPVLDLCHVETFSGNFLCALNDKRADLFKMDFI